MKTNRRIKAVSMVICIMIVSAVCLAPTNKTGQLQGKFNVGTTSAVLNGANTITGTPFKLHGSTGNISVFYKATAGTSTPHYKIVVYTSPRNATYTTQSVATITASSDETSTEFKHRDVPIPYAPWARIDIIGIAPNATNTTFDLDIPYQ